MLEYSKIIRSIKVVDLIAGLGSLGLAVYQYEQKRVFDFEVGLLLFASVISFLFVWLSPLRWVIYKLTGLRVS